MITTRAPETMTTDERRQEAASILAAGPLRRVRVSKAPAADATLIGFPRGNLNHVLA